MEIIKVGTKNLCTCGKCGTVMRPSDSDVRIKKHTPSPSYYDDPDPEDYYKTYVTCPVCQNSVSYGSHMKSQLMKRAIHDDDF